MVKPKVILLKRAMMALEERRGSLANTILGDAMALGDASTTSLASRFILRVGSFADHAEFAQGCLWLL
jgi:hypothetical protein